MRGGNAVAGIDRWRGGWVIATAGNALRLDVAETIAQARTMTADCGTVAIDMPMALPRSGKRAAEDELRTLLGPAARSVFTSPTRAAIEATSQAEATEINRRHEGPGISAQAWGLARSIRELRAALRGAADRRCWFETHPESAFALMAEGDVLAAKRSARGVAQRLQLLRHHFTGLDESLLAAPERVPVDDVLDAIAAAWSARRLAAGRARRFGPDGFDDQGYRQAVYV